MRLTKKQRKNLDKMFTKSYLINDEDSATERLLIEVLLGISGSFYSKLWVAFNSAHFLYKERIVEAFPETNSWLRYLIEEGYYEYLYKKYMNKL